MPPLDSRTAYVVLAHRQPSQVARLIRALAPAPVHLHVDSGAARPDAAALLALGDGERVHLVPRIRTGWASWNLVAAALDGMEAALAGGAHHIVILSGSCYPLWSQRRIDEFLAQHKGRSFVYRKMLPADQQDRITHWHLPVAGRKLRSPVPRRPPLLDYVAGAPYNIFAADAARYLLRFVADRPDVIRFFRRVWIPEESFVATVLWGSPLAASLVNEYLWYIDWSAGGAHPRWLTTNDLPAISAAAAGPSTVSGYGRVKLFARKFDEGRDAEVLGRIDDELHSRPLTPDRTLSVDTVDPAPDRPDCHP